MIRFPILAAVLFFGCIVPAKIASPQVRAERAYIWQNTIDVGNVEEDYMLDAALRFIAIAAAGEKEITLRIDSFGGSIFLGNRWIKNLEDIKKRNGIRVVCIVDGAAYSMGAVILESPLCDLRLATNRSTILFHNGSSGARGTAEDLKQAVNFLEALNLSMALSVSSRLLITIEEYKSRIAHADWVMAVPEAVQSNVIDGVANPDDIAPPFETT